MPSYVLPTNAAPTSSAALARESQERVHYNEGVLGLHGRQAQLALGGIRPALNQNFQPIEGPGAVRGGSGYGGYNGGIDPLLADWQANYDRARKANEDRYNAIRGGGSDENAARGGYEGRYARGLGLLEKLGGQELADTAQRYDQQAASMQQDLTSRGLAGTTVLPTMKLGVQREKSDALSRVNQRLIGQQMAADAALSGDQLAFMERRTDSYPDAAMLARLAQQFGQVGGGQQQQGFRPPMQMMDLGGGGGFGFQMPGMGAGMQPWARWWNNPGGMAAGGGYNGGFMTGPPVPAGTFGGSAGRASGGGASAMPYSEFTVDGMVPPSGNWDDSPGGMNYYDPSVRAPSAPIDPRSIMEPSSGAHHFYPGSTDYVSSGPPRFDPSSIMAPSTGAYQPSPEGWFF